MRPFKIGDVIMIYGNQDAVLFSGVKGRIVCWYPSYTDDKSKSFGIDFSEFPNEYSKIGYFHTLSGVLKTPTGYWVERNLIRLANIPRTGFGQFIRNIEKTEKEADSDKIDCILT